MGKVIQLFTAWVNKITDFFKSCEPEEMVLVIAIAAIPVLAIIWGIVALAHGAKQRRIRKQEKAKAAEQKAQEEAALAQTGITPAAVSSSPNGEIEYIPSNQQSPVTEVRIIERVVKQPDRPKVKVRLVNLKKADRYLLLSTGIFCVGLGAVIQRAMSSDK